MGTSGPAKGSRRAKKARFLGGRVRIRPREGFAFAAEAIGDAAGAAKNYTRSQIAISFKQNTPLRAVKE